MKVKTRRFLAGVVLATVSASAAALWLTRARVAGQTSTPPWQFHLREATIGDVHRAIKEGQLTCRGLVQAYINRAQAYNGVANALVTESGAPVMYRKMGAILQPVTAARARRFSMRGSS